mgnify:CR=1 FL=1
MSKNCDLTSQLKLHFGFDSFKGNQRDIVQNVLDGKDTFVLMPTGGGLPPDPAPRRRIQAVCGNATADRTYGIPTDCILSALTGIR